MKDKTTVLFPPPKWACSLLGPSGALLRTEGREEGAANRQRRWRTGSRPFLGGHSWEARLPAQPAGPPRASVSPSVEGAGCTCGVPRSFGIELRISEPFYMSELRVVLQVRPEGGTLGDTGLCAITDLHAYSRGLPPGTGVGFCPPPHSKEEEAETPVCICSGSCGGLCPPLRCGDRGPHSWAETWT